MADPLDDYEKVSVYPLDDVVRETVLRTHSECTFLWTRATAGPSA